MMPITVSIPLCPPSLPVVDVLSYGVFTGEEFPHEGLIDESYTGRVGTVVFVEVAPREERGS